jgi:hypothetical protein
MKLQSNQQERSTVLCTWQNDEVCKGCSLKSRIMCRFESKDMVTFLMSSLGYAVATIVSVIITGYGWYLLLWLAYSIFFFFVWEARILCSHCPMWAEESRVLHCHANSGVIKIWKYKPGPMSKSEQTQFIIGAVIWIGFPFIFLLLAQAYALAIIGLAAAATAVHSVKKLSCTRCINFSCPMNEVPKETVDAYLERNPLMRAAWEDSGYKLG